MFFNRTLLGKVKQKKWGGDFPQMWVGGVADSQTRSKHLKTSPNHPENRIFRPEFHLSFSQISEKPWGGWVNRFGRALPKKTFFLRFPWTILVWTVKNDIGWWWSTFWHSTGSFGSHRIEEVQVKIPANYNEDFDVSSSNVFIPNLLRQRPLFRFGAKRPLYIN